MSTKSSLYYSSEMHLYKEFNKVFSILAHPDNIVRQELLIKNEYYI